MANHSEGVSWRARYATNIPTIDAHHQGLFKVLRMLREASLHGRMEVKVILEHLERHTLDHFAAEESLMRRTGFSGLDAHIQDHGQFLRHLGDMERQCKENGPGAAAEAVPVLYGWVHDHILAHDMVFAEHVRSESSS